MKYETLSNRYNELESDVHNALIEEIERTGIKSKHMNAKCIHVNIFDYSELVYYSNELTFLDNNGYHYSLYSECSLEDLIDILTQYI